MLSIRARLTLYYLAILSAVLIFFGMAIYAYLSRSLLTIIDSSLIYETRQIERQMTAPVMSDSGSEPEEISTEHLMSAAQIVQIIDDRGEVRDETGLLMKLHLPVVPEKLLKISNDQPQLETIALASGEQLRLITKRATFPDGESFFIRIGQSLKPLQVARRRLIWLLGIAVPIALLLGSYGGWMLANQALHPVDRITCAAEQISASDLAQRVPLPGKMDEIGRLAKTFNSMIARLQTAFERQRQFTSAASHEMRTPLAVMRGEIEVTLRRERSPEEYRQTLSSSLEEIKRLSRLVEDLLTLARGDAGQSLLQREPVILGELCAQTVGYLRPLAEDRQQSLSLEESKSPLVISGDTQRLQQMLLNLLDNAIKYTGQGGNIRLGLNATDTDALITITDTGRGIPAEDLPHIFERFFRHSKTTADRTASGFGLGLSIVKWIVDSHGGNIEASSTPGQGTTFTVRLPLMKTDAHSTS
jgi:heavy metal sensor kinase